MEKLIRYLKTVSLIPIEPKSISTRELLSELKEAGYEIGIRTLERDLNKLSGTGLFPFTCSGVENKKEIETNRRWFWPRNAKRIQLPAMTPEEAIVLLLSDKFLSPILPNSIKNYLASYFSMAENSLKLSPLKDWENKVEIIPSSQKLIKAKIDEKIVNSVFEALLKNKSMIIEYSSRSSMFEVKGVRTKKISPQALIYNGHTFYLQCIENDNVYNILTIGLHKIISAKVTDLELLKFIHKTHIETEEEKKRKEKLLELYPIREYESSPKLTLLINNELAERLATTPLSEDQKITKRETGEYELVATVEYTRQLKEWLHSFSDSIIIIKPERLRDEFSGKARNLHRLYNVNKIT